MVTKISRRTFLKTGLIGALALAAAGGLYRATRNPVALEKFVLDGEARSALAAIVGAMLNGAMSAPSAQVIGAEIDRVQGAIAGLPLITQNEIQDLFGLLTLTPTRRFLAGLPDQWSAAKPADVTAFLQSWRTHRIGMLQSAYHALHDLIIGPWYADPASWDAIGYPGPPKLS